MFKVVNTWRNPAAPASAQRGFPAPGTGAQTTGPYTPTPGESPMDAPAIDPFATLSWMFQTPASQQRGGPAPENALQRTNRNVQPVAQPEPIYTPGWIPDFGAAFYAPQFGQVTINPIGAGVQVLQRPQASYGGSGQYFTDTIFWTNQVIPTSVELNGLYSPEQIQALLSTLHVEEAISTTG